VSALPSQPVDAVLATTARANPGRADVARSRLQRTLHTLDDLERRALQLHRLSLRPGPDAVRLRKLAEQEQALRTQLKRVQGFETVYQDDIDLAVQAAARAKTLRDNLAASRVLYQVVSDGCAFFRPLVEQALQALDREPEPDAASAHSASLAVAEPS
jgi:hypothetical protein